MGYGSSQERKVKMDSCPGVPDTGNDPSKRGRKKEILVCERNTSHSFALLSFIEVAGDANRVTQGRVE